MQGVGIVSQVHYPISSPEMTGVMGGYREVATPYRLQDKVFGFGMWHRDLGCKTEPGDSLQEGKEERRPMREQYSQEKNPDDPGERRMRGISSLPM